MSICHHQSSVSVLSFTQGENGAISQHWCASKSSFLSSWQQTMTRRALRDCTLGPLQRHAERLLWAGRRESTKVSYSGKWMRFVNFCTLTLPSEYGMQPRKTLPASMSTVLLYLSHLSQEGEVREGSLNPYFISSSPHATATCRGTRYFVVGAVFQR